MSFVLDYSFARPDPAQIKASGALGVIRYISHDMSKDLTIAERDALQAQQLGINLIFETTETRATEGAQAGADDAAFAFSRAQSLGYPKDVPIYVCLQDQGGMIWAQVKAYATAWALKMDVAYQQAWGGYAGIDILAALSGVYTWAHLWQTSGWSGGHIHPSLTLYQNANHDSPVDGTDWNEIYDEDSLWTPWKPTPHNDTPKEDDMLLISNNLNPLPAGVVGEISVVSASGRRHLTESEFTAYSKLGLESKQLSLEDYNAIQLIDNAVTVHVEGD